MYKNLFRSLVFSLLFTLPMIAYAVDGVGIFEFFPAQRRDGGWEANVAPDLLEYNSVVDRAFGVQWVSYRLSDQRTQKVLLSASYFSNRSKGPMSCEAATMYWKLRMQFTKKAWAGGKTPSGT
jgi:hypothetical protein